MCSEFTPVPAGYIVTSMYSKATCGVSNEFGNTYVLATPRAGLAICSEATPVPAGYVVTSMYNSATCNVFNDFGNTYVLGVKP